MRRTTTGLVMAALLTLAAAACGGASGPQEASGMAMPEVATTPTDPTGAPIAPASDDLVALGNQICAETEPALDPPEGMPDSELVGALRTASAGYKARAVRLAALPAEGATAEQISRAVGDLDSISGNLGRAANNLESGNRPTFEVQMQSIGGFDRRAAGILVGLGMGECAVPT